MRKLIFSLCLLVFATTIVPAQQYDLVLEGGRVMDPETGLDAVRNVGIRDGKIARVSSEALNGRRVVHVSGLVVAPGFIDLHQHGQDLESQRVKALDGVTTALNWKSACPTSSSSKSQGRALSNPLRHVGQPCTARAGCSARPCRAERPVPMPAP
jgi:N-acyl-D-aspartate/D-glutamate deacylase